jgi:ATP-dependent DNA helicase RecG
VFDNRVEISNPGGLVSAIPEAEFGKRSHSRNPLIFGLFARMHLVDQVGSGIGRIQQLMKDANLPEPVFQKEGIFTVILLRTFSASEKTTPKTTQKTAQKIIQLINENKNITSVEMAEKLEMTRGAVAKQIAKLIQQGFIERIGSRKNGYWNLLTNKQD